MSKVIGDVDPVAVSTLEGPLIKDSSSESVDVSALIIRVALFGSTCFVFLTMAGLDWIPTDLIMFSWRSAAAFLKIAKFLL